MGKKIKHFTATVYVVHRNKVLLHWHKKLKRWLPPGGHIEEGELPDQAAVREVKEETGLSIKLIGTRPRNFKGVKPLCLPQFVQEEYVIDHYHIDLLYLGKPVSGKLMEGRWFSLKDLRSKKIGPDVRYHAKLMLKKLRQGKI